MLSPPLRIMRRGRRRSRLNMYSIWILLYVRSVCFLWPAKVMNIVRVRFTGDSREAGRRRVRSGGPAAQGIVPSHAVDLTYTPYVDLALTLQCWCSGRRATCRTTCAGRSASSWWTSRWSLRRASRTTAKTSKSTSRCAFDVIPPVSLHASRLRFWTRAL